MLTVATAVWNDPRGIWFTLDSLRKFHPPEIKILVLDNAPRPSKETENVVKAYNGKYVYNPTLTGTSASRSSLFVLAEEEWGPGWVCVIDSHVTFPKGALEYLGGFVHGAGANSKDLITGPLLYESGDLSSHWLQVNKGALWGEWTCDREKVKDGRPFEIWAQGLGCFAMHTKAWPGFNPHHHGYGAEECYIHEIVRRNGGKCLCLPKLKWAHCFLLPEQRAPSSNDVYFRNLVLHYAALGYNPSFPVNTHPWSCKTCHAKQMNLMNEMEKLYPGCWKSDKLPDAFAPRSLEMIETITPTPKAPEVVVAPEKLNVLGIWYSNNRAPVETLHASLESIRKAVNASRYKVEIVTCPWLEIEDNPFREVVYGQQKVGSHLHIVKQMEKSLAAAKNNPDVVCCLEHDVLYAPDYFNRVGDAFLSSKAEVVSNLDYEGVCPRGYQRVKERHEPMHQLSMRIDRFKKNLQRCLLEATAASGFCLLEPDSMVPQQRTGWLRLPYQGQQPCIHVGHSQRAFTTHHEVCYESNVWAEFHDYWGEAKQYFPS